MSVDDMARVTRLGDFSAIGRLFTLGGFFLKRTELAQFFVLLLQLWLFLTKHGLGCVLGEVFTNSSGHPDHGFEWSGGINSCYWLR
jgi:hypothetical protein